MARKTIFLYALVSCIILLCTQAWATPLPPDPRVIGNTASGWSYTDSTGEIPGLASGLDVNLVTGSLNMTTYTLSFEISTVTTPGGGMGSGYGYYGDSWYLGLDLNLDGTQDAAAGAWADIDYSNWDYYTYPPPILWYSYDSGLAAPSTTTIGSTVTIDAPITQSQAELILMDGFQFNFLVGNLYDGPPEDAADAYGGTLPYPLVDGWLYVVPEPGSILLLGSGLALLIPIIRRKGKSS